MSLSWAQLAIRFLVWELGRRFWDSLLLINKVPKKPIAVAITHLQVPYIVCIKRFDECFNYPQQFFSGMNCQHFGWHIPKPPCVLFRKGEHLGGFCKSERSFRETVKRLWTKRPRWKKWRFYRSDMKQDNAPKSRVVAIGKCPNRLPNGLCLVLK